MTGAKKWILYPPHCVPPGVHPSADGADVATPLSLTEWFLNFYQEAREGQVGGRWGRGSWARAWVVGMTHGRVFWSWAWAKSYMSYMFHLTHLACMRR